MRLHQAFSEHSNELFDNRSVILLGDFDQLPSVFDLSIYADNKQDALFNSNLAVYKQFKETYKLETIQHQLKNSKEQQEFRNILLKMHNKESSIEDWKILTIRIKDKFNMIKQNEFSNTLFLLTK